MQVKEEVLSYFQSKGLHPNDMSNLNECYYLDMGIVEMLTEFEQRFHIQFDSDHLQSYDFVTLGGLIGIIEGLVDKKQ